MSLLLLYFAQYDMEKFFANDYSTNSVQIPLNILIAVNVLLVVFVWLLKGWRSDIT